MTTTSRQDIPEGLWRPLALPFSLILNLFLTGLIAGHLLHGTTPPQTRVDQAPQGAPLWRAMADLEGRLSRPDAAAFAGTLARDRARTAADSRQLLDARLELARQVSAERFDREATRRALTQWRTSWDRFLDDFSGTLVDALDQVSPEGRRELVRAAEQRRERLISSP